ncbi:conserved hypothetical protein [Ricinus communis]|uniref:CHHC U11-48K-type domain-containing protein n=1 Tax=Ricinus communis TaxID=3988 RepID=B9SHL0_RICCO|nr:conserved hypothetical protein [Ricinus communis]
MNPSSAPYPDYFQNSNYPIPNFVFHSLPQPPPPHIPTITPTTPILDLSTTLSSLANLLSLSQQTRNSLSSLIKPNKNVKFISCPYNPNHLMPPESLFLHSLRCPSPSFQDPISLVNSLHYPKTLNSQNPSNPLFKNSDNAELCLSLDGFYNEFSSNFFYKDCPGAVQFSDLDSSSKTFLLPAVLSVECANFVARIEEDIKGFDINEFRILPSDLWVIKREVESWADYPSMYSYAVFCAILRLNVIKGSDLRRWIIFNSPRYGVVIDVYMRDHISVLFRLCLNAIRREAFSFMGHQMNVKTSSFNCPVLSQVFMWIVPQLSVLYGERNAKCFAIHIFRQCILDVSNGMLFPLEANVKEISTELNGNGSDVRDIKLQEPLEGSIKCETDAEVEEHVDKEVIFVSQVAASVAALHERALLEAKIQGTRESQSLPRYQRMIEHDYVSKRADEQRKERSNYRAIIDHDGLPRRQPIDEDMSKTKTREEILAEERDYKRRRMSYRGKKLKRTTLQVTRDLIEEYMDEIKQAGGIGCFEKGAEEEGMSSKPPFPSDFTIGGGELRKSSSKSSEAIRATPNHYQKQSHIDNNNRSATCKNASTQDYERWRKVHNRHHEHVEYQRKDSRDRHGRDYYSASPERHKGHGPLHEREDAEFNISKRHDKRSSGKSNYQNYKSSCFGSDSANDPGVQKDGDKLDVRDWHLRNSYGTHSSTFLVKNAFEDRYDPAE